MAVSRNWQDLSTADFAAADMSRVIAVLPVGAIEQHGPHLPVSVDATINAGMIERTLEILPPEIPVCVLPSQDIGKSTEHLSFPGTLTFSTETLTRIWTEIGEAVARAGVRKLVIFNSHGGQPQVADIVARDLRIRCKMFVAVVNWFQLDLPPGLFGAEEVANGIHAGEIETSIMLHLRPDLVDMSKAEDFTPLAAQMGEAFPVLRPTGPVRFAWAAEDLNAAGACGNAAAADATRGAQLVDHIGQRFAEILTEIDRVPPDLFHGSARWSV